MKEITDYTGEELAEVLSGEFQRLLQVIGNVVNATLTLNWVQNELERRKLEKADGKSSN